MASGKIQGIAGGFSQLYYNFWAEWSAVPNSADNSSTFTATTYLQRKDGVSNSDYNLNVDKNERYISIDGKKFFSNSSVIDTRNGKKVVIATVKTQIPHNPDGYKTIDFYATYPKVSDDLLNGTIEARISFDKISVISDLKFLEIKFTGISQKTVVANVKTNANAEEWYFSLNFGQSWIAISDEKTDLLVERIDGLEPNTAYSVIFKAVQSATGKEYISDVTYFKTLPIYITDLKISSTIFGKLGFALEEPIIEPENATIKQLNVTSDDNNIVSVINNVPIATGIGTTKITYAAKDGSGISKTVNADIYYPIERVEINPSRIVLAKGEVLKIPYSFVPDYVYNKNVTIISSNENVIKINGSIATAVEEGTAIITVIPEDGGKSATAVIEVSGEYNWYKYSEPIEILNSEDINKIISNINTIKILLEKSGRTIGEITPIVAVKSNLLENVVDILWDIEYDLDVLNSTDIVSIYGDKTFQIHEKTPDKEEIWRWLQCLEDLYNILNGNFGKWQYLMCSDGYLTIDGKPIIVRGDLIG